MLEELPKKKKRKKKMWSQYHPSSPPLTPPNRGENANPDTQSYGAGAQDSRQMRLSFRVKRSETRNPLRIAPTPEKVWILFQTFFFVVYLKNEVFK